LITADEIGKVTASTAGLIVVDAAPFSHTLIALLSRGIPTVLVTAAQARRLELGHPIHIDGTTGTLCDPADAGPRHEPPPTPTDAPRTADGTRVTLLASVRSPQAARRARDLGAQGIGLVRSEFLQPPDGSIPDADFYTATLRELLEAATPLPVTFRLLDIAADKRPAWLPAGDTVGQPLGLQGVRLFGRGPVDKVVLDQLVAISELAQETDLRVLLPFVVRVEEFAYWRQILGEHLPRHVPVGAMAETVASVLDIDRLLDAADFVAVGCNDLMQAVFSADRDEPVLRDYLDPYAPVLLRLFRHIAEQSGDRLARVQLCGFLPQVRGLMPVLMGMGYRCFSVDGPFIPYLARELAGKSLDACEALARDACRAATTREVLKKLGMPTSRPPPFLP
jgi:phosphoenolpyruvate-protein kinase (PTS system EI component)